METRTTGQGTSDAFGDLVVACDRSIVAFKALGAGAAAVRDASDTLTAYCCRTLGEKPVAGRG